MSSSLPVMEHFYSLQGEGANAGKAAYFIRLGGCDVGCHWCDVKESWDFEGHEKLNVDDLVNEVYLTGTPNVVVTGGEPTLHNLDYLSQAIKSKNINTFIETAGTNVITGNWDWVCLSPKKFKPCLEDNFTKADELKVVVLNKHDLKWAKELASKTNSNCKLFLQPEWDKSKVVLPLIIEYVKENPKWQISLQTHKFLNIR